MSNAGQNRILCDGVDITEQVAAMYDAIATSMDWGSNFLTDDVVEAILLVGQLAGFSFVDPDYGDELRSTWRETELPAERVKRYEDALTRCRAQYQAKLNAKIKELKGDV